MYISITKVESTHQDEKLLLMKTSPRRGETCVMCISDCWFLPRRYKEIQINQKTRQFKNEQKTWTNTSQSEIHSCPISRWEEAQHHQFSGKCKWESQGDTVVHPPWWLKFRVDSIKCWQHCCWGWRTVRPENSLEVSHEIEHTLPNDSTIPSKRNKNNNHTRALCKNVYSSIFHGGQNLDKM